MRLILLVTAFSLIIAGGSRAQTPARTSDERAVRDLVAAYAVAREQRDPQKLAAILAPHADQLVSSGEWRRGRDELTRGMLASSEANSGRRTLTVHTVRFIAPGVAIADARYEIAGTGGAPARRMWSSFIAARVDGAWRIEGIRNMLPTGNR